MGNTNIEILLAVLVATVFLGDFIWKKVKGRKTNQESSLEVEKDSESKANSRPPQWLNFISRNVPYILFLILLNKFLIWFVYTPPQVDHFSGGIRFRSTDAGWDDLISLIFKDGIIQTALFYEEFLQYGPALLIAIILFYFAFLSIFKKAELVNFISRLKGYILFRKRNVTMFLLTIPITKLLLHFTVFPYSTGRITRGSGLYHESWFGGNRKFGWYIENFFTEEIVLFIPAIILPLLFVFLINDKIKAR